MPKMKTKLLEQQVRKGEEAENNSGRNQAYFSF
jgi:hypothetical protein